MYEEIKDNVEVFIDNIFYKVKSFKTGVKNLIKYRKIIWEDRWYDHYFMLNLWIFKLEDMINNWDQSHYEGSDFTKKRMQVILRDLILLRDDDFEDAYFQEVYKKWGNPTDYSLDDFLQKTYIPVEKHPEYSKDIKEAFIKSNKDKNKIKNRVFTRLKRNYERFWD